MCKKCRKKFECIGKGRLLFLGFLECILLVFIVFVSGFVFDIGFIFFF